MPEDLNHLSDDAVLMLYLADELSASQRAQVEKRLVTDAAFRAGCESLRILNSETRRFVSADSAASSTELADEMTVRRVVREMNKRRLELVARPAASSAPRRRAYPAWIYPLAACAAIVFLVLGMWGVGVIDYDPPTKPITIDDTPMIEHDEDALELGLEPDQELAELDEAELHLAELAKEGDAAERLDLSL